MKILTTADIHIFDHHNYEKLDKDGVSDRLKQFETLGKDLAQLAKKKKVDMIVMAGDIMHAPLVRPIVHMYGELFLKEVCGPGVPVILTHGQHDLDTKSHTLSAMHSIIKSVAPNLGNLMYCFDRTEFKEKGVKFFVHPWIEETTEVKYMPADVFIGHGIVDGTANNEGYTFTGGFSPNALLKRYLLTVIGDLHKGQVVKAEKGPNKILVPGAPIQTSYKDDANCGVWIAEVVPGKTANLDFISIYDLRDDGTYHKFLTVDEEDFDGENIPEHVHVKIRTTKAGAFNDEGAKATYTLGDATLPEVVMNEVQELKAENEKTFRFIIDKAFKIVEPEAERSPVPVLVTGVNAYNFMSIELLKLALGGELVVLGKNGHGKTTVAEAIYYGITGNRTKGKTVAKIRNKYLDADPEVEVFFTTLRDGVKWKIWRGRDGGSGYLLLFQIDKAGKEHPYKGPKGSDTQETLYNILGMDEEDVKLLCYYSAKQAKSFTDIGDTEKNSIIGRLSGIAQVDALRNAVESLMDTYSQENDVSQGNLEAWEAQLQSFQRQLADVKEKEDQETKKLDKKAIKEILDGLIEYEGEPVVVMLKLLKALDAATLKKMDFSKKYDTTNIDRDVAEQKSKIAVLSSSADSKRRKLSEMEQQMGILDEGKCDRCGHELKDRTLFEEMSQAYNALDSEIGSINTRLGQMNELLKHLELKAEEIHSSNAARDAKNAKLKSLSDRIQKAIKTLEDKGAPKTDYSALKKSLKANIAEMQEKIESVKGERETFDELMSVGRIILRKILNKTGPVVRRYNEIICKLFSDEINSLIPDKKVVEARITSGKSLNLELRFEGMEWMEVDEFSGGEERIANILQMVALNNLFSKKYGLKYGVLGLAIFDEIFSFLDPQYTDLAFAALEACVVKTKMVITHDTRIQSHFHRVLKVERRKGISHYALVQ